MTENSRPADPNRPAPGWYPDGRGAQRYWDGSAWTEHVAPAGPAASNGSATNATPVRPWFRKKRFIIPIGLVALLLVGSALGGGTDPSSDTTTAAASTTNKDASDDKRAAEDKTDSKDDAPAASKTTDPPKKDKPKTKVVRVRAERILKDYEDNELAADKKYKGKSIQVTGTVDKIDTEIFDTDQYVLRISDGSEFSFLTVNCNDMSSDELSTLTVGDRVTAVGKFEDGGDLGVELAKCKLA